MSTLCRQGMERIKKTICLILIAVLLITIAFEGKALASVKPGCKANPATALKILMTSLTTIYNVFPISIGGIRIFHFKGVDDYNSIPGFPLCICKMPPPLFIRVGIKFSMWEAGHLMETVKHPWCSPTVGLQLPVPFNILAEGKSEDEVQTKERSAAAQVHMIIYPVWMIIGMFLDVVCLQALRSFDFLYFTELDPLWQNDMWATLLGPEAFLVANPIAQAVCAVDSIAATVWRSIDVLFWCMGAWGSTYPMSQNMSSAGYVQAQAGLASRMIAKLHRQLLLWGTIGPPTVTGWCQRYPMPIWVKRQYNLLLLHPVPMKLRTVIGKPGLIWTPLKNPPFIGDDFVWMLYNKRDCCLF